MDNNTKHLHMTMDGPIASRFYEILQNGFGIKCHVGISVKSLLCEELALNPRYVSEKISTIFLDGKCVDDIDSAIIKSKTTIAVSASMPGLAGATMRRKGAYASLRSSITYNEKNQAGKTTGVCFIKLFNLLIGDLGPFFLGRGILVRTRDMINFLRRQYPLFKTQTFAHPF